MVFMNINGDEFLIHKIIMKCCGLWPEDRRKLLSLIAFTIFSLIKITVVISYLIDCHNDIRTGAHAYLILVYMPVVLLSQSLVRIHSDRTTRVIESIIHNWASVRNPKERQIMKHHEKLGTYHFAVMFVYFPALSIIRDVTSFPFFKPGNVELSVKEQAALNDHYTWVMMVSVLTVVVNFHVGCTNYSTLMLFWSLSMHLSGQFKILKMNVQNFLEIKNKNKSRRDFRRLVERHNKLLDLSGDLETSFTIFLGLNIFLSHTYICLQAFQLAVVIRTGNLIAFTDSIHSFAMGLWILFIHYYAGEYLSTCSEDIGDQLSECEWYNLSKDSRTNFSIVILRCQMSATLSVAKLHKLNFLNYKQMLETVYSYISFILVIG